MIEYAIEADPGKLTASFPTAESWDDVVRAREFLRGRGVPASRVGDAWPRILARVAGGRWEATEVPLVVDVDVPLFEIGGAA